MPLTKIDDRGLTTPIDLLDNEKIRLGTGNDLELFHGGTNSLIRNNTGGGLLLIQGNGDAGQYVAIQPKPSENGVVTKPDAAVELYYDNSKKLETSAGGIRVTGGVNTTGASSFSGDIYFGDNKKTIFGAGSDLQIYHDGSNSVIDNQTGYLVIKSSATEAVYLQGNVVMGQPSGGGEIYFEGNKDGAFEAYYDNSKKLETTSTGAGVIGDLALSGELNMTTGGNYNRFIDCFFR